MRITRITIIKIRRPEKNNLNEELQFLGYSLGLFSERDKDKSCFRIFITLLKALKKGKRLTSDEIAELTNLSRGTVIHHLNKLMETGIVINEKNYYIISVDNVKELVSQAKENVIRMLDNIAEVADNIDKKMDL